MATHRTIRHGVRCLLLTTTALILFGTPTEAADPIAWRTDYNAARREAEQKGLPLFVEIGTENCFYCRKLENGPFRHPVLASLIQGSFIPLKIDANREPGLARALKVSLYPTMVLAGHDGKIHAFLEGYMESDRIQVAMKRALVASEMPEAVAQDLQGASRALALADYPRAVTLLKSAIQQLGDKPAGTKAKETLALVERQAEAELAKARQLQDRGKSGESAETLTELLQTYAGTKAAADAADLLAGLGEEAELRARTRARRARELFALAQSDFRTLKYYDCLQHCDQLTNQFADLPEAKDARALAVEVRTSPERLAIACEQMTERTALMYLSLAESWAKKGQFKEAIACLEKVIQLSPETKFSTEAQNKMAQITGQAVGVTTGFRKPE